MTEREQQANNVLQNIAKDIKAKLPKGMGFALLTYEFGDAENRRMMYISNSNREDVMLAMVEFLEKNLNDLEMYGKDV